MKTPKAISKQPHNRIAARVLAILGAAFLNVGVSMAVEATADTNTRNNNDGSTNALLGIAIPVAVFDNIPTQGKDPFFPNSTRRAPIVKVAAPVAVVQSAPVNNASLLTLRGISGSASKRIALINNLTFVAGEEGKVRIPTGQLKLRVIEVKDSSAIIQIDGETIRREIKLRDGVTEKNTTVTSF